MWGVVEQVWQLAEENRLEDALSHYHADWHRWGYDAPDLWGRDHLRAFLRATNDGIETRWRYGRNWSNSTAPPPWCTTSDDANDPA